MKMSKRETVLLLITLVAVLFGLTYWMAGSRIAEHREMKNSKTRLLREIEINKRILAEKDGWYSRLEELQSQLPEYDEKVVVSAKMPTIISQIAATHGLSLGKTTPSPEKQVGSLYELRISVTWDGTLDQLVHFLYDIQMQGIRFDVREFNATPDAQREGILRGSMNIDCAYRKKS